MAAPLTHTLLPWLLGIAVPLVVGCPHATPPPTPAVSRITTQVSAQAPQVREPVAALDVHGGDGDGSIALWSLHLSCDVANPGPAAIVVHVLRWETLELGLTSQRPTARVLQPGESLRLSADAFIAVEDLDRVRGVETVPTRWTIVWSTGGGPAAEHQVEVPAVVQSW